MANTGSKGLFTAFFLAAGCAFAAAFDASGATLPPHRPLRILLVGDNVNPHGLPAGDLTEVHDIYLALTAPGNGLTLDAGPNAVLEVATNSIEQATAALSVPFGSASAYHVVLYFAHRIPNNGMNDVARQAAFVAAVQSFLEAGGGFVSFHHGSYFTAGKEAIQDLIGGTASGAVPWDTVNGQNVIAVAPGHFITTNGLAYPSTVAYADVPRGVPAGNYPTFNNTPDERYPTFSLNPSAGTIKMLFASDYNDNGTTHVLGFVHKRPTWRGRVVVYQPAEYQPNALDPNGRNFQILANALVHAAGAVITSFHTLAPCRLVDTRAGQAPALVAGATRTFVVGGGCAVPVSARAVSVNATIVSPTEAGYLTLHPGGSPRPLASSINYTAGQVRANNAILTLGELSDLGVFCGQAGGSVHLVLDVNGYFE